MKAFVPLVGFVVLVALAQAGASADLRNNLVPMTSSNNAGPKYDIEFNTPELSPSTLSSSSSSTSDNSEKKSQAEREANSEANNGANDEESQPIGTVHVRRIYIVPSMGPSSWFSNPFSMMSPAQSMDNNPTVSIDRRPSTSLFGRDTPSLWSLLGGGGSGLMDESPSMDNGDVETNVERRKETQDTQASETKPSSFANDVDRRPTSMSPDPRDLLMDMLQQMLQTRLTAFRNHFDDMMPSASSETNNNNDTSNNKNTNNSNDNASFKPGTHNETKEDIVEYDGIKYLRKTIITKNIGQNHMFYTKRYILRPLNETTTTTSGTNESTTTTAGTPTTSFTRGESTTSQPPMTSAATEVTSASSTERPSSASSPVTESISPKKEADVNREQLEKEDTLVTPLSTPMIEGTDNARLVRKKGANHDD